MKYRIQYSDSPSNGIIKNKDLNLVGNVFTNRYYLREMFFSRCMGVLYKGWIILQENGNKWRDITKYLIKECERYAQFNILFHKGNCDYCRALAFVNHERYGNINEEINGIEKTNVDEIYVQKIRDCYDSGWFPKSLFKNYGEIA